MRRPFDLVPLWSELLGVSSAVLPVFPVSSCCCDLLCVVLLPKSAGELCVVGVTPGKVDGVFTVWY